MLHSISDAQDFIKHVKKEIAKGATLPSMQPGAELQTLFLAAKVRTKSKPPNKTKKKVEFNHKKSGETSEKATRTSEKQKRNEQKRRLRTQSEARVNLGLRTQSGLRTQNKKRGEEKPSKNIRVVLLCRNPSF